MSIDEGFKKMLDGIRQADEGRDEVLRGLEEAWHGRQDLDTHIQDLDETIAELKVLIMDQGRELKALHERLNGDN